MNFAATRILNEVQAEFSVTLPDLRGARRTSHIALARQVACYLLREYTTMSYVEIGAQVNRHHTTVMHAVEKLRSEQDLDTALIEKIATIIQQLGLHIGRADLPDFSVLQEKVDRIAYGSDNGELLSSADIHVICREVLRLQGIEKAATMVARIAVALDRKLPDLMRYATDDLSDLLIDFDGAVQVKDANQPLLAD